MSKAKSTSARKPAATRRAAPVSEAAAAAVPTITTDTFKTADGLSIYCAVWRPAGKAKRMVILVHGFADHLGRYSYLIPDLVANGAVVYAYDQRGAGKSAGKRGHVVAYQQLVDELDQFVRLATEAEPDLPRVIYAHSTGAILALTYLYEHPDAVDGVVLSAPCLILTADAPAWKTAVGRALSRIAPSFTMQAGFEPETVSRDEKVVAANKADPLVTQAITARFFTEVYLNALSNAFARVEDLKVPYLLLQGTADKLVSPRVADEFENRATAPGVIKRYEGGFHESHNDIQRDEVFADVEAWLNQLDSLAPAAPLAREPAASAGAIPTAPAARRQRKPAAGASRRPAASTATKPAPSAGRKPAASTTSKPVPAAPKPSTARKAAASSSRKPAASAAKPAASAIRKSPPKTAQRRKAAVK